MTDHSPIAVRPPPRRLTARALWGARFLLVILLGVTHPGTSATEPYDLKTVGLPWYNRSPRYRAVSAVGSALLVGHLWGFNNTGVYYLVPSSTNASVPLVFRRIVGNNKTGCSDQGSPTMKMNPVSLTSISERQFLVTESMYSSRIWLGSTQSTHISSSNPLNVSKAVGGLCNFTETMFMRNNSNVSGNLNIAPPEFVSYRFSTNAMYFTQRASIVQVLGQIATGYLGNDTRASSRTAQHRMPIFRTETMTYFPGQMALVESLNAMFFPEQSGTIRKVDFFTGVVEVVAGAANLDSWPPPSCNSTSPCGALTAAGSGRALYLVSVSALAFYRKGSSPVLYFGDNTLSLLFEMDLQQNTVTSVAGKLLNYGRRDGPPGVSRIYGSARQLMIFAETLYLTDGNLRYMKLPNGTADSPTKRLCDVMKHCYAHAWSVDGLPAIGCRCQCKKGWMPPYCQHRAPWDPETRTQTFSNSRSQSPSLSASSTRTTTASVSTTQELTKTRELTVTHSFYIPKKPKKPGVLSPEVIETATTTAEVTAVVVSVVSTPTTATQATRASVLLRITSCEPEFDEELSWAESVTKMTVGDDELRFLRGAIVGNLAVFYGALLLHAAAALLYSQYKKVGYLQGFADFRFPSLAAFPVLLLAEGTMMAACRILIHSPRDDDKVFGVLGIASCLLIFACAFYVIRFQFNSKFTRLPQEHTTPHTVKEILEDRFEWLFYESGKWENSTNGFRKRYGGFFRDYASHTRWFVLPELFMCVAIGLLNAILPGEGASCNAVTVILSAIYVVYFVVLMYYLPYLQRWANILGILVACLQALGGALLVAYVLTGDRTWEKTSADVVLASMYILIVDAILALLDIIRKLVHFFRIRCRGAADSSSSDVSLLEVPMMDNTTGLRQDFNPAGDLSDSFARRLERPEDPFASLENRTPELPFPTTPSLPSPMIIHQQAPPPPPPKEKTPGLLDHERRRIELQALLDHGASSSVQQRPIVGQLGGARSTGSLLGDSPLPTSMLLPLTSTARALGPAGSSSSNSTGTGSGRPGSSSGSGEVMSNVSFSSLLAEMRQNESSSGVALTPPGVSASARNRLTIAGPQQPTASSQSSGSSNASNFLLPPAAAQSSGTSSSSSGAARSSANALHYPPLGPGVWGGSDSTGTSSGSSASVIRNMQ